MDVTLFATADSPTAAALESVCPHGYAEDPDMDGRVWEALHVSHALDRSGEFDLVHNHLDWLPLCFAGHFAAPLVTTIHGFSGTRHPARVPGARSSSYVSISDADRAPDSTTSRRSTTASTSTPSRSARGRGPGRLGRIHPDKGTAEAIDHREARRAPAGDLRDRPGPAVLRRAGGAAHRR